MNFEENDDSMLPKATVDRMVSSMLPKNTVVPKESKDIFLRGCMRFLNILTREASRACEAEKKKTINHEHICKALDGLGFGSYVKDCMEEHKNYEGYIRQKPSRMNKFKDSGLTMEELHDQQLKLFQNAKLQFDQSLEDDHHEEDV